MKYTDIYQEYNALLLQSSDYLRKLIGLKEGRISTKIISGKPYVYLQKRQGYTMNSEYIKDEMLVQVKTELRERAEAEKTLEAINERLDELENAAKTLDKSLYRKMTTLRRCFRMDSLPLDMRKKALSFGSSITALEGLPASEETANKLSLWAQGQYSYKDLYFQTLDKYYAEEVR